MIRKVLAFIAIALAIWATLFMLNLDSEANKMQRIAELIKSTSTEDKKLAIKPTQTTTPPVSQTSAALVQKDNKNTEVEEKLKALKEKAGNIAAFNVSPLYKKRCASCHGNIGQGVIGPKLIGKTKEKILTALKDFKSGKRKNYVMYGLLSNINDEQLENLAAEISTFQSKLDKAAK